jgi:hypothetical protein
VHRVEVADDSHAHRLDGAGADALDQPEHDQRRHRPGDAAQERADEEHGDPGEQHRPPSVEVGQLAEHHRGGGLREQERREDPGIEVQVAEPAGNLRHGGRDDGGLDGDHEHGRHDGGQHERAAACRCGRHRGQARLSATAENLP